MKNLAFFLPILFVTGIFCKKENTVNTEQILVDGNWYHDSYLLDKDGDGVFTNELFPCQTGDVWKFDANNHFEIRDEIEYCNTDVDSVAIISGLWELQNNDSEIQIVIGLGFEVVQFKIHAINDTLLELRAYNDPGTPYPPEERVILKR